MKPATPREFLIFVALDEYKALRQDTALTHQQVADALDYSVQTARNWETGKTRIPWPAFELMRIRNCHHLPGLVWKSWQIRDEVLFDPASNRYDPGDIASLFYLRPLVRALQLELQERRRQDGPKAPEQITLDALEPIWKERS